jgi:hypothetical protein
MKYSLTREQLDMSRTIDVRLIVSDDITESDIGESLTFMEGLEKAYILRNAVPNKMPIVIVDQKPGG